MFRAALTSGHVAHPQRRNRLLTVTLAAAVIAVGAGAVASTGLPEADRPTGPGAWPTGPIEFNDAAVVKGARGGKESTVIFPYFGDPILRKGAGANER